jgi:hypothetical protein
MTKQDKTTYLGLPAALVAGGAIVFFLLNTAFVSHQEYEKDVQRLERKLDCALWDLPKDCRFTMSPRGEP